MSTEGQHGYDACGKEKTKVLTFTDAVNFFLLLFIIILFTNREL